jgi:hypothetical protein
VKWFTNRGGWFQEAVRPGRDHEFHLSPAMTETTALLGIVLAM